MKSKVKAILRVLNVVQLLIFIAMITLVILVFIFPDGFTRRFAQFLVIDKDVQKSDAVVVIGGGEGWKRLEEGLSQYKAGNGKWLVFTGMGETMERKAAERIEEEGIDPVNVLIDSFATSTYENATYTYQMAQERDWKSIIVVCTPQQSRRARFIFERVYKDMDIHITYSDESSYDPASIFGDKAMRESFSNEAVKLMYYIAKYSFK